VSGEVAGYLAESAEQNQSCGVSHSGAVALLTEPELVEAIIGFGIIGSNILLTQYRVKWGC